MKTITVVLGLGLLGGFAAGAILYGHKGPNAAAIPSAGSAPGSFDPTDPLEGRVRALETALGEERDARQLLEDELQSVYAELDRLEAGATGGAPSTNGEDASASAASGRVTRFGSSRSPADRAKGLVDGGFSQDRADWIVKRESELQMQAMQAIFEARRNSEPFDPSAPGMNPQSTLRAEIGDDEYEKYLQATGRPTAVDVGTVLESSPAQRAGLQAGDQITAYDGKRVFNYWDLNQQTLEGAPGSSVVVDIVRDGVPMQVVLPRGAIGISMNRRWGPRQ
jgi:PDZ domain